MERISTGNHGFSRTYSERIDDGVFCMDLNAGNYIEAINTTATVIDLICKYALRDTKEKVYAILTDMHFGPKGVLRILKAIRDGEKLPPKEFQKIIRDFNDEEFEMQGVFARLDDLLERDRVKIPIAHRHALSLLTDDKAGIRYALHREIDYYDPDKQPRPNKNVRKLVEAIERLNASIEAMDKDLRRA